MSDANIVAIEIAPLLDPRAKANDIGPIATNGWHQIQRLNAADGQTIGTTLVSNELKELKESRIGRLATNQVRGLV